MAKQKGQLVFTWCVWVWSSGCGMSHALYNAYWTTKPQKENMEESSSYAGGPSALQCVQENREGEQRCDLSQCLDQQSI